ncbi:hypothetical protein ACQ5SO_14675 [Rhodovulum sp. DZ06]|uniref:hypothetical protein n=1 Tax=Rhodovulum sp. DZ06 TaxID=3425126 RepID=UPI003D35311B
MARHLFTAAVLGFCAAAPLVAAAGPIPPLTEAQLTIIKGYALAELDAFSQDPGVIYAIEEQNGLNARLTQRRIERLDRAWQAGDSHSLMARELMGRQESFFLHERREKSDGVITEFIVMDRLGLNVAISDYTSDLWQGDEAMFLETFPRGVGAIHVSAPNTDDHLHRVQVEVSVTIAAPDTGAPIGALTVGIDVERALEKAGESAVGEAGTEHLQDPA